MSDARPLLIELGGEELPPKALDNLAAAFAAGICAGLEKSGIAADTAHAQVFCTPRRLAVRVPAVATRQADQSIERRGPSLEAGRDADGQPSRALSGFARSCGVPVEALDTLQTDKGSWFVYRAEQPGKATAEVLPGILAEAVKGLPIPRPMRWGDHDYSFVRPVHWLLVLHGEEVIDAELLGLKSGRETRGHRFHAPAALSIAHADEWLDALRAAHVLADPAERRERIVAQVGSAVSDGTPKLSNELLDELANLTEWPVAIACSFERDFLRVPAEALVTTMEANQKFVPVFDADNKLSEHFVGVANIDSRDPAQVRAGYERVIRPRFADARFFFEQDLKTPLAEHQQGLASVTYQKALGSVWDKCCRVAELARVLANRCGVDAGKATHAASLAKCDLLTRMVGEFPSLQGVMGSHYARAQGEDAEVAAALDTFYMPRHAGDAIAPDALARVLSVAERLDTLVGIFAVGLRPSGNKDPFALRRAALGLARTLIEGNIDIDLGAAFTEALQLLPEAALQAGATGKSPAAFDAAARRAELLDDVLAFVHERLRGYYAEQGFDHDTFEAVAAVQPASLVDFDQRLRAVAEFSRRPEAASLAAANKRVGNILRKLDESDRPASTVDDGLLVDPAEKQLAEALAAAGQSSMRACEAGDYAVALSALAQLQGPVDQFFDQVLVMADDPDLRGNRLALLGELQRRFLAIADVACLSR